jgi:hypothetical protein
MQITLRLGHQILISSKRAANQGSECDVKIAVPLRSESDISETFLGFLNFCVVFNQWNSNDSLAEGICSFLFDRFEANAEKMLINGLFITF